MTNKKTNKTMKNPSTGKQRKVALGKGLDALLPEMLPLNESNKDYFQCDIDLIRPNRYQPRRQFKEAELDELTQSIKEQGIIQPLLVRQDEGNFDRWDSFQQDSLWNQRVLWPFSFQQSKRHRV